MLTYATYADFAQGGLILALRFALTYRLTYMLAYMLAYTVSKRKLAVSIYVLYMRTYMSLILLDDVVILLSVCRL